eukprot:CAMPEP_0115835652 /NCGR_PEP_ID=MMETSP0287-20121206/4305_1 /TAXON_ID=412157 /ORGANISM="Chrysochromulina rotalis, Strain UIO044" /LENGTH=74 /DNA_ID=CAMNT_0003289117 /DNA_START=558 /DNA_END=782 /DNA_ORIENTATION=-
MCRARAARRRVRPDDGAHRTRAAAPFIAPAGGATFTPLVTFDPDARCTAVWVVPARPTRATYLMGHRAVESNTL